MSVPLNLINDPEDLEADSFQVSAWVLTQPKKMTMALTSAAWRRVVGTRPLSFSIMIDAILATI